MYISLENANLLSTVTKHSSFLLQLTLFKQSMLVMECMRLPTGSSQHQTMTDMQLLSTTWLTYTVRVLLYTFISSLPDLLLSGLRSWNRLRSMK